VKGGLVGGSTLSNQDFTRLADLPSREVLLARFAGALAAPLQQLAGLLQALPRNFAYGLSALIEERGGAPVPAEAAAPDEAAPAAQGGTDAEAAAASEPADEAPPEETVDAVEAPAEEPTGDDSAGEPDGEA